ncbi:hypothetical protein O181_103274 [Austropuccinia psidii MF-1]|uniref:Uncharacterized protein n=1 Tax=Austropuccinia psidii MF-1 TaxID=1389203 RepID=A0A9Q3JKV8_9BASI|nr:hypothetical protein [Austropuccinia psidii MF-1]
MTILSQECPRRSCHSRELKAMLIDWDIGFISIADKSQEGGTATDLLVPSVVKTSIHQQLLLKLVVTRKPQTRRDRFRSSKTGTTPTVHKRLTDKIVPEILL